MTPTSNCPNSLAIDRTRVLLGCYRRGECEDPEVYVAALAVVFEAYPEAVVRAVTHPLDGIAGRLQWLPSVAEVKRACDAELAPILQAEARERRERELRGRIAGPPAESDETRAAVVARWQSMRLEMAPPEQPPAEPKRSLEEAIATTGPLPRLSDEALARVRRREAAP